MKKILIGTHNQGKYREISYLISKKFTKISPVSLKLASPKETGKTFHENALLKANYFSKYVNYPVISDDSGLCIKSLKNKPGIYSARLAKKCGSFIKAMRYIFEKNDQKKRIVQHISFVVLVLRIQKVKQSPLREKIHEKYQKKF